jgi:hypothetical protein
MAEASRSPEPPSQPSATPPPTLPARQHPFEHRLLRVQRRDSPRQLKPAQPGDSAALTQALIASAATLMHGE